MLKLDNMKFKISKTS